MQPTTPSKQDWTTNVLSLSSILAAVVEKGGSKTSPPPELLAYITQTHKAQAGILFKVDPDTKEIKIENNVFFSKFDAPADTIIKEASQHTQLLAQTKKSGVFQVKSIEGFYKFIVVPIIYQGTLERFICIIKECYKNDEIIQALVSLQCSSGFYLYGHASKENDLNKWAFLKASSLLEIIANASKSHDFSHACQTLANDLQAHLPCSFVVVASYNNHKASALALSKTANFDKRSPRTKAIELAIKEAIDAKTPQVYPPNTLSDEDTPPVLKKHQELQLLLHSKKIITIPLKSHETDEYLGGLVFVWDDRIPFNEKATNIALAAAPHLEITFEVIQRAQPTVFKRLFNQISSSLSKNERRLILVATALALIILVLPFKYKVRADAKLEPVARRHIEAPFASVLERAFVEPGAIVTKNQVLAQLEEKDLTSKIAEVSAARNQALKESSSALAERNPAEARISQLEAQKLSAQLSILNERLSKLKILSPIDGIVVSGDLKRFEGSPLSTGDQLLEIAPLDNMLVEVAIPEDDIRHINKGMEIQLSLDAFPGSTWESTITTIKPRAEIRDNRNIFIAEAKLNNKTNDLRPGMKGKAKVFTVDKPLYWILLHKAWDFLRMLLFW